MLHLSRTSQYAVRTLTFLAQQPPAQYQLTRRIAEALDIPGPFLSKVLQPLVLRGLVDSQRGRSGGVRLARSASEITMFEVVDALEHLRRPRECMLGQSDCTDERACPFHTEWKAAWHNREEVLRRTTVEDFKGFCDRAPEAGYPVR
ncbi:MAG: Rrf2 family iron-sulfur cluster assembly transcriptional regulator [Planctomycetota bacterium]|jgi:Rrf2 family iron-sulfur cluster assembly transcriptional regulator